MVGEAVMGELARRLGDPFVPAGHVVDQHHARARAAAERARVIGFAHVAVVAAKRNRFRKHAFIGHAVPLPDSCAAAPLADYTSAQLRPSRKNAAV